MIAAHATGATVVVEKSTVPVKAADCIEQILNASSNSATFQVQMVGDR
jgi:UDP-glucose 6-dehydrogenase